MKWLWLALFAAALCAMVLGSPEGHQAGAPKATEGEVWEEDDREVLIRSERGAKNRGKQTCRYVKSQWTECDPKNNMRSRTLTLKKGDADTCEQTKTVQKKCKKACRYDRGAWSECNAQQQMTRTDKLKDNSDPSCEQSRQSSRKCNKNKPTKNNKEKGGRRNRQ